MTTLRAPGSTRSSRSSSTTRTSIGRARRPRLVDQRRRTVRHVEVHLARRRRRARRPTPVPSARARPTRVKPRRAHAWRTSVASTSSGRMARSSSAPSSTSCSRWPRLLRSARSLTAENNAAHTAKSRNATALDDGDAVVERVRGLRPRRRRRPRAASSSSSANHTRELEPGAVRRDQRHRHHVEEHEEEERAAVAAGHRDAERDREAVEQHAPRDDGDGVRRGEPAQHLDAGHHDQVHERDRDRPTRLDPGEGRDHEQRDQVEQPQELQDEQPVGDRRPGGVPRRGHRKRATSGPLRAAASLRSPRSARRCTARKSDDRQQQRR